MKDRHALVQGWFRKADSDLADARRTVTSEGPYDTACFHAQQAVEKYLKGYLAWREQAIPRTHDLEELQRLCVELERNNERAEKGQTPLRGASPGREAEERTTLSPGRPSVPSA